MLIVTIPPLAVENVVVPHTNTMYLEFSSTLARPAVDALKQKNEEHHHIGSSFQKVQRNYISSCSMDHVTMIQRLNLERKTNLLLAMHHLRH